MRFRRIIILGLVFKNTKEDEERKRREEESGGNPLKNFSLQS